MRTHKMFPLLLVAQGLRPILSGLKYFQLIRASSSFSSLETVRVGFPKVEYLPFISKENATGRLVGYYVDLAKTLLNLAGLNSTFIMSENAGYNTLGNCLGNILFFSPKPILETALHI